MLVIVLCGVAMVGSAQWILGVKGGWDITTITRYDASRIDESYSPLGGYEAGIRAGYAFKDWVAVRAELSVMRRSHRMDRNLNYLDSLYTNHHNLYLMLPVTVDFSFGGKRLRGHALLGGYAGYWLRERVAGKTYWMTDYYVWFNDFDEVCPFTGEDRRFCAGLTGGVGLSCSVGDHWGLDLEALYYYDLTSHHKGYPNLRDPRYLNTLSITFGATYTF